MSFGLGLTLVDFLLAVVVLAVWGDHWLDWVYQACVAVALVLGYLLVLGGLQWLAREPNRWRGLPVLLFAAYPWWVMVRELLIM